jgi:putative ABC transport system ATP-binding protein
MGALDKPTSGTIEVDGEVITKGSDHELIKYRRNMIGFVFQSFNLVPNLTATENVMLPMEFAGMKTSARAERAGKLLDRVGLTGDKQTRRPSRLSGGEQQRVAVARAIANRPRLILADEPTGNLDSKTGREIIELLRDLARSRETTIVTVTHDPAIAHSADVVFELEDARLRIASTV